MIDNLLRFLGRTGIRKGLGPSPGGRGWVAIGIAAWLIRFLQRKANEPKVHLNEKLGPGETIVIRHLAKDEAV